MENLLEEILYELKKINNKLYENDCKMAVTTSEEVIVEKVIENINKQNRVRDKSTIVVA